MLRDIEDGERLSAHEPDRRISKKIAWESNHTDVALPSQVYRLPGHFLYIRDYRISFILGPDNVIDSYRRPKPKHAFPG